MKRALYWVALSLFVAFCVSAAPGTTSVPGEAAQHDERLAAYFRAETALLANRCLADIRSLEDWEARRVEYRRQLQEMLGLWPAPERTDLKPVITGRLEQPDFTVEKLYFQALPKLYVTACAGYSLCVRPQPCGQEWRELR